MGAKRNFGFRIPDCGLQMEGESREQRQKTKEISHFELPIKAGGRGPKQGAGSMEFLLPANILC
jgi:hypothetical protein